MARISVTPTTSEQEFRIEELFFSTTDRKGIITSGNSVFQRVAAYEYADLIGKPHNLIRHPDMPRAVFKLLWDYLETGKSIVAYVKNMASNGNYYWVVALATPVPGGYLSIRFKPSSPIFSKIQEVYKQLLAVEQDAEAKGMTRKAAMDLSSRQLMEIVSSLGFASYDELMHTILHTELSSREAQISGLVRSSGGSSLGRGHLATMSVECSRMLSSFNRLFNSLDLFIGLNQKLQEKSHFITNLNRSMRLVSFNAFLESARLGTLGATFEIVAQRMGKSSEDITKSVQGLDEHFSSLGRLVKEVIYNSAAAKLQIEMTSGFLSEVLMGEGVVDGSSNGADSSVGKINSLNRAFEGSSGAVLEQMGAVQGSLQKVISEVAMLQQTVSSLEFVYLNGRIEANRLSNKGNVFVILNDILQKLNSTRTELRDLSDSLRKIRESTKMMNEIEQQVRRSAHAFARSLEALNEEGREESEVSDVSVEINNDPLLSVQP